MSNLKTDVINLILAICIKQSKVKYVLVEEYNYKEQAKRVISTYTLSKYHKEKLLNPETNKKKVTRILDERVRGSLLEILLYLNKEYKNLGG